MAAYFIVDLTIEDMPGLQRYIEEVPATIQKYGGRYLVRGAAWEPVEGNWEPNRIVLLEFPTLETAKAWYASEEYKPLKAARLKASRANIILVEGVPE
jgi:uncharacterized protein (DUF1330 family)